MTPAVDAARKAGIDHEVIEYEHDPSHESFGLEAVEVLGLPGEQVFKTLVAEVDGRLAVGIVPVVAQLDLKAFAAVIGGRKAVMAPADAAQRATGYVLGGISPLGQKRRLPSVIDASAEALERMYVSAGRRGLEIALAPSDLARLSGARFAPIARW